jgi:hypothetical protein
LMILLLGRELTGQMKVHRGKTHKYLDMSLDFLHKGQCQVTIYD